MDTSLRHGHVSVCRYADGSLFYLLVAPNRPGMWTVTLWEQPPSGPARGTGTEFRSEMGDLDEVCRRLRAWAGEYLAYWDALFTCVIGVLRPSGHRVAKYLVNPGVWCRLTEDRQRRTYHGTIDDEEAPVEADPSVPRDRVHVVLEDGTREDYPVEWPEGRGTGSA